MTFSPWHRERRRISTNGGQLEKYAYHQSPTSHMGIAEIWRLDRSSPIFTELYVKPNGDILRLGSFHTAVNGYRGFLIAGRDPLLIWPNCQFLNRCEHELCYVRELATSAYMNDTDVVFCDSFPLLLDRPGVDRLCYWLGSIVNEIGLILTRVQKIIWEDEGYSGCYFPFRCFMSLRIYPSHDINDQYSCWIGY